MLFVIIHFSESFEMKERINLLFSWVVLNNDMIKAIPKKKKKKNSREKKHTILTQYLEK